MDFRPTDQQLSDAVRQYIQQQLGFKLTEEFQLSDIAASCRDYALDSTFTLSATRDSEQVTLAASESPIGQAAIAQGMQDRKQALIQAGLEPYKAAILKAISAQPTLLFDGRPIELGQDACSWYDSSTCSHCHGDGCHTCAACDGHASVTCGGCGGVGSNPCSSCHTSGYTVEVYSENGHERQRQVPCGRCGASGHASCGQCGGSGAVSCRACHDGTVTCDSCDGAGTVYRRFFLTVRADVAGSARPVSGAFATGRPANDLEPTYYGDFAGPQWQSHAGGDGVSIACKRFETKATLSLGGETYACVFAGKTPVLASAPGLVGAFFEKLVKAMDDPGNIKGIAAVNATPIAQELVRESAFGVPTSMLSAVQRGTMMEGQAAHYLKRFAAVRAHHSERAGKFTLRGVGLAMRDVFLRLAAMVVMAFVAKYFVYSPPSLAALLTLQPTAVSMWSVYFAAGGVSAYLLLPMISARLTRKASSHWLKMLVTAVLFTLPVLFAAELPLVVGLILAVIITPLIALPRVKKLDRARADSTLKKMGYAGLVAD
ncbi:hypothetical protein [Geopseudomonas aromaticivorans]